MKKVLVNSDGDQFLRLISRILSMTAVGEGATHSFYKEYSQDCHFLDFNKSSETGEPPWTRIQFYPGQADSVSGIDYIEIVTDEERWRIKGQFDEGTEIFRIIRPSPRTPKNRI